MDFSYSQLFWPSVRHYVLTPRFREFTAIGPLPSALDLFCQQTTRMGNNGSYGAAVRRRIPDVNEEQHIRTEHQSRHAVMRNRCSLPGWIPAFGKLRNYRHLPRRTILVRLVCTNDLFKIIIIIKHQHCDANFGPKLHLFGQFKDLWLFELQAICICSFCNRLQPLCWNMPFPFLNK